VCSRAEMVAQFFGGGDAGQLRQPAELGQVPVGAFRASP